MGGPADSTRRVASTPDSILDEVLSERLRQVQRHGYDAAHDDGHDLGELALAAALYVLPYDAKVGSEALLKQRDFIGLDMTLEIACGFKLKPEPDPRRRLIKAMALLAAEVERRDRVGARRG